MFNYLFRATCAAVLFSASLATAQNTLVVAINSDPGQFNPAITTGAHVHVVADSMFNGLVGLDADLQPVPDLATDWTVAEDGLTYTFTLAAANWHDGRAVTSADVKFTFENILFKYHSRTKSGLSSVVSAIETPDDRTVVFRLNKPHPAFLRRLNVTEAAIMPKHLYEGAGDPAEAPANTAPVGSGPFKFVSYSPGNNVVLEENTDYFKGDVTDIDRVVFRIIKDSETTLLAFERGEVDYIPRIGGKDVARIKSLENGGVLFSTAGPGGGNCIMTISFNLDREAQQMIAFRRAMAKAINRDRLLEQVLFGYGQVAVAPFSSAIGWAYDPNALADLSYDPEAAKMILDEAGFTPDANGVRLSIDMVHFPKFSKYSELMAQDLAKVGIKLTPRPLDRSAAIDAIFKQRDFDTNLISYCNGVDPEIGIKRMYVSSNIAPIPFSNASAYRNDKVDALFAAAGNSADEAVRASAYKDIQGILAAELPYFWLVETTRNAAINTSYGSFKPWSGHFLETVRLMQ